MRAVALVKTGAIRVLIVDDHAIVREGLRAVLKAEGSVQVVGEAANGRLALDAVKSLKPDVVLMDLIMPVMDGIAATKAVLAAFPAVHVLVLSSYPEKDLVERALEAGATGYLLKHSASVEVVKAIQRVHEGTPFFSDAISRMLVAVGGLSPTNKTIVPHLQLTPRQSEVLQLIAEGQCNKQIAGSMGISIKTVEKHRQELMQRLNIHTIAGLTRYALAKGMLPAEPGRELDLATNALATANPAAARGRAPKVSSRARV